LTLRLVEMLVLVLVLVLTVALGVLDVHCASPILTLHVCCVTRSIRHVTPLALTY
jgi:hypothetical protein